MSEGPFLGSPHAPGEAILHVFPGQRVAPGILDLGRVPDFREEFRFLGKSMQDAKWLASLGWEEVAYLLFKDQAGLELYTCEFLNVSSTLLLWIKRPLFARYWGFP